ncbi:MAG: hypothetical protein JW841_05880 [Deltaproteobacteria bacterium]|nr:hypothetical protein [Deltaproteobacteria bacterium]
MKNKLVSLLLFFSWSSLALAAEDNTPPAIVHEPCEQFKIGESFEIKARFIDDSAIFDPKVIYRSRNEFWKNVPFVRETNSDDFKAVISSKDLSNKLFYFIEAFDENGNGPARYGSPDAPIELEASDNPPVCQQLSDFGHIPSLHASSNAMTEPKEITDDTNVVGAAGSSKISKTKTSKSAKTSTSDDLTEQPASTRDMDANDFKREPPLPPPSTCERSDRPIYCSPWFWGITGAVLLGGGGVLGYMLLKKDEQIPNQLYINVRAPSPVETGLMVR